MTSFDGVAAEYEAGRPGYPDAVYDALAPIAGMQVLEGGAGTGIATRELIRRGGRVVAFDIGFTVLTRAIATTSGLPAVVADGARMPFRDGCVDLLCFAQSWHWLDESRRAGEAARVLRVGARWAGWWSHARADGEPWFETTWDLIEATTPARRVHRDVDWGEELRGSRLFDVDERATSRWKRAVTVERWLDDERSKSYISALPAPARASLLRAIESFIRERFPDGQMEVPYETWLWLARKT